MIKAIDVQQVIIQIEHAGKVQQQHPEMQQRYLEIQSQEEKKLMQEKVRNADETRHARIREEERRERRRNDGDHTEKRMEDLNEEQTKEMPQHGGHINIKI
jgi:hypothetical protein